MKGNGGVVDFWVIFFIFNYFKKENEKKDNDLEVVVRNVRFNNCSVFYGGVLSIVYDGGNFGVVIISNSFFIFNEVFVGKGGVI